MADLTTLYDIISGTIGAVIGALVTVFATQHRNQSLRNKIASIGRELNGFRQENDRLMQLIEQRENQILALEHKIADAVPVPSVRTRKRKS